MCLHSPNSIQLLRPRKERTKHLQVLQWCENVLSFIKRSILYEIVAQISWDIFCTSLSEEYSRASDEPKKYGEGSQVLKTCKPPSLVEYENARKGGDAKVSLAFGRMFKYGNCCEWSSCWHHCSKVKEAIKRVEKEGLQTDVKKENKRCLLIFL